MKSLKAILLVMMLSNYLAAQDRAFVVTPFVGINTTRMNLSPAFDNSYSKGGNYFVAGLETELRLVTGKSKRYDLAVLTGVGYLSNGFKATYTKAIINTNSTDGYDYKNIELTMQYLQIPLELKIRWQPFPLIEDFHLFAGVGISGNLLMKANLAEKSVLSGNLTDSFVILGFDPSSRPFPPYEYQPPYTQTYEDQADVTAMRNKLTWFGRIEFGMTYDRVHLAIRFSSALQDTYFTGLENAWAVPQDRSIYLKGRSVQGRILEKYSEVVMGFRLF